MEGTVNHCSVTPTQKYTEATIKEQDQYLLLYGRTNRKRASKMTSSRLLLCTSGRMYLQVWKLFTKHTQETPCATVISQLITTVLLQVSREDAWDWISEWLPARYQHRGVLVLHSLLQLYAKQELQWAGVILQPLPRRGPTCASLAQGKRSTVERGKLYLHVV